MRKPGAGGGRMLVPGGAPPMPRFALRREMKALIATVEPMLAAQASAVLHLVAAVPGEGTSTIASSFARHAAQEDGARVLLLRVGDAPEDTAGDEAQTIPPVMDQFEALGRIEAPESGLGQGGLWVADLTQRGGAPLRRAAMEGLYRHLRDTFTLTVVDCPSAAEMPDMIGFSTLADGIVLVIAAGRTRIPVVERARDLIDAAGGRLLGVVLNRRRSYVPKWLYERL